MMTTTTTAIEDWDLVEEYAATGSHAAFDGIVRRHAGWVYAAALRRVRSADLADDVTQATFIVLARKAGSLSRRRPASSLAAWLYRVVTYVGIDALRQRGARLRHERLAARREARVPGEDSGDREIIAHLDAALDELGRRDREAIILRYFNDQTLTEIAAAQRVAASTVQRRLARSLARIGRRLQRHGITTAPAALPATLMAIGRLSAPASATHGLTALAAAAGSLPAQTAGPIGLAHGALKAMSMMKVKAAAAIVVAFTLLGGGGAVATRYAMARVGGNAVARTAKVKEPVGASAMSAPAPAAARAAAATQSLHDAAFANRLTANWRSVNLDITHVNAANPDVKNKDSRTMNVDAQAVISDTSNILGFDRSARMHVTRAVDDAGHDVTNQVAASPNGMPTWYQPLRYNHIYDQKTQRWDDVLAPVQFTVALRTDVELPRKLSRLEGYLMALTYDDLTNVDVPFTPNGKPVEIMPGIHIHFSKADHDAHSFSYALVSDEPQKGREFNGLLYPGESAPAKIVSRQEFVDAAGKPIDEQPHSGEFGGSRSINGSGGSGGDLRQLAAMRFVIANGVKERHVPVVLANVEVPRVGDAGGK